MVDLSSRVSGAFAARLFGDFGADVMLVERPDGHALRREPPFVDDAEGSDRGVLHAYVNWNKRSLVVENAAGIPDLLAKADVLVTNADPPGEAWFAGALPGLSREAVHLSITPHGLTSPLTGRAGNNLTASARTGWSFINGYREEPPLQMPREQAGYVGGVAGFLAAAAALRRRDVADQAEMVDVSEIEALALTVHPWAVAAVYEATGFCNGPGGGRYRGEPGPLWDAADGQMNFGFGDFHNWAAAMQLLGLPELGERADLIPDEGRHSKDLSAVVAGTSRTLADMERWPVFHGLAALRCISGVLQDTHDIVNDPQLAARHFLVETELAGKRLRAAGAPARLAPSPWQLRAPAPQVGENGGAFVAEWTHSLAHQSSRNPSRISASTLSEGPLQGVRVLSFAQAWSGTFGTELLALLGADVVQIASLHRTDTWRRVRGHVPAGVLDRGRVQHPRNTQGLYNSVNLNKREITLDIRRERGREMLWKLLPRFDIVAENFRPTVLPSWGITLEKLHELRPGMIWAAISAYGTDGPYREYPGNGATTEPMSGLSSLHGYEGDTGKNTGGLYPDPISGYLFAATVLAALAHRDRTGEPQRIDLSMMEAVAAVCGDAIVEYDATGRVPRPRGNHHPRVAPHNNYAARDGEWLALATETEDAWAAFAQLTGDPRLREARFATMAARKANEAELDELVAEWCAGQDAKGAEASLGRLGVTTARVVPIYEIYSLPDPNFVASGFLERVEHPEAGITWLPGRPWRFQQWPSSPLRGAPCIGQHSREVFAEELGIDDAEYEELVRAGVTGTLDDLAPEA